ncbi:MAG TPA: hypothetical protein VF601_04225 [Beijerinckiaceae bacterium]|jgi:hypothetical protein
METKKARSERLMAAAVVALEGAATPRGAVRAMMKATGEGSRVCRGYLASSPAWPWRGVRHRRAGPAPDIDPGTPVVRVRRQWNDLRRIATYRLADMADFHWSKVGGGIGRRAPQAFLHAYVMCDEILAGDLAHSCRHGPPPHRIKVCITRKDNPAVFKALLEIAPKPGAPGRDGRGAAVS